MSAVPFIDAYSLGLLIGAVRFAERLGGELALREPSRAVRRALRLLELDGRFPIED